MLYFIVNESSRSGKGMKVWHQIEEILKKRQVPYTISKSEYAGHAGQIVSDLCNSTDTKVDLIIIGGDGTINEVINSITDFGKIRLGVIPAGSGNDFARELKISKNPTTCIHHLLDECEEKIIDLGCIRWNHKKIDVFLQSAPVLVWMPLSVKRH